jgi:hypothetical protein
MSYYASEAGPCRRDVCTWRPVHTTYIVAAFIARAAR